MTIPQTRLAALRKIATVLLAAGLLATGSSPTPAADNRWVGNDAFNNSNFSESGNWLNGQNPTWSSSNSLIFTENQNANVTGLVYNLGWNAVDDIKWATTFPVPRTLSSSNGNGIDFRVRMENLSSFTQTVTLNTSGGKYGANEIQLNPVNGSLILSGTIYNDNSLDYVVWGSLSSTTTNLTLNTALGTHNTPSAVDFTVSAGRNSNVQVNASQVWAGTTTVNSGSFITANGVTLASSAIVVAGGTVASTSANTFADTATLTVNSGRLSIGGSDTVASLAGTGGTVDLAAGTTLTAGDAGSTSYAGSITGSGGFTKVGSGTLTLSGANSYNGGTTISAGRLVGTTDGLQGAITNNAVVEFAQATSGTYAGSMSGAGSLTKSGSGVVVLTGSNGFSGGVSLNAGTLAVGSANALGSSGTISFGGGTLRYSASNTIDNSAQFSNASGQQYSIDTSGQSVTLTSNLTSSGGSFTKLGAGNLTLSGTNSYDGGTTVSGGRLLGTTTSLQGAITNNAAVEFAQAASGTYSGSMAGSGSLTKNGAGSVTLSGTNSYTGGTFIGAGMLSLGSADAIGSVGSVVFGGGKLQYSAANTTDYSSRFVAALGAGNYAIDTNGQDVTFASPLTSSGLDKFGDGSLALTGSNTYIAPTNVYGGTLLFNGNSSGVVDLVNVLPGAALGGSGAIGGSVSVFTGGTLAPGNSIESLAVGATTFSSASTFEYEYDTSAPLSVGGDLLVVNGSLSIGAGSLITFADLASSPSPFADGTIFALINYSGAWNNGLFTYNTTPLTDGSRFFAGSQEWEIDYNRTSTTGLANYTGDYLPSSSFVAITAVPEPATWAMALTGLAAGGLMIRRRSRS